MNINEARLLIHSTIADTLVSLGLSDEPTEEEIEQLDEEMREIADILLEELGFSITSVNEDGSFTAHLVLLNEEDDDQE
jgi:hypothetical protein